MRFTVTGYENRNIDISAIVDSDINLSYMIPQSLGVQRGTRLIVPAGTPVPSDDAQCLGLARWDYDVTEGDRPGSIMMFGFVNQDKLKAMPSAAARTAMQGRITFWHEDVLNPASPTKLLPTIVDYEWLPGATAGTAYTHTLTTRGSTPITITAKGTLPAGLSVSTAGAFSGTPTAAGTYTIVLVATNAVGTAQKEFKLDVAAAEEEEGGGGGGG